MKIINYEELLVQDEVNNFRGDPPAHSECCFQETCVAPQPHLFSLSVSDSGLMGLAQGLHEPRGEPSPPTDRGVTALAVLLWSKGEPG